MIHICEKCFERLYRLAKDRGIIWRADVTPNDEDVLCDICQEEHAIFVFAHNRDCHGCPMENKALCEGVGIHIPLFLNRPQCLTCDRHPIYSLFEFFVPCLPDNQPKGGDKP